MRQFSLFSTLAIRIFNRRKFRMFRRASGTKTESLKKKQLAMKLSQIPLSISPQMTVAF